MEAAHRAHGAGRAIDIPRQRTRAPKAGLHILQGSLLIEGMPGCGVPGAFEGICGATLAADSPPTRPSVGNVSASPNPFNPRTNISFRLSQAQDVQVKVYGLRGDLIQTLNAGSLAAGEHSLSWQGVDQAGRTVGSGVYFAVIQGELDTHRLKLTLLK